MDSILPEDNAHWENPEAYNHFMRREALQHAMNLIAQQEIIAIIGARRVGKSTLAKLMISELLHQGVESRQIFFINLEKPTFIPYKEDATYLQKIFDAYLKLAEPDIHNTIYFFIDEIQIFHNWEMFVKSRYENSKIKFIITGSNSSLLTSNYATLLTGRVLKMKLSSFNFREFLTYKEIDISSRIKIAQNRLAIQKAKDEYLKWGGYYSVISNHNEQVKKEILKNIAEDIILKDIVPRYKIKNSNEIKDLFYYVVSNASSLLNYTSLAKKLNIDSKMVKEYIGYFEDNFLVTLISKKHHKVSESIKSAKKVYLNDNGFLNLGVTPERNLGTGLENLVFTTLNRCDTPLYYLRENKEVDFCIKHRMMQVSYTIQDEKTKIRELSAFKEFNTTNAEQTLITYDENRSENEVEIISYDQFALEFNCN